ncbi:MAG: Zn-ribbon domain-containing OB-fold protein [Dehalococcoidia bacterium]|nr:Zn-ribbon domain-containing OB-fold protein [Dehalococcoidia bacterium]
MNREGRIIEDKVSRVKREWEEYARKGNWTVKGYEIVKAPAGADRLEDSKEEEYMVIYRPHGVLYNHSYGLVSKFFKGLIDGKLLGTRCPLCKTVYCPPRMHCWNPACRVADADWTDLPLKGRVHTFSVMLFSADAFLEMLPFVLAYVQIEGADTALPIQVVTNPTDVFVGQKLEIRFREERKGDLMDIYAVPVPGQAVPKRSCLHMNPEYVKDLERNLEYTYSFLEKRFGIKKEEVKKRWETA